MNLVKDSDLAYELILSRGKGLLTRKGGTLIYDLCKNAMKVKQGQYSCLDDQHDAFISGVDMALRGYINYNRDRKSVPYITEIFKRGMTHYVVNIIKYKENSKNISFSNIDIL